MRILVVEDDRKVASFIQKGLEEEGFAVDVLSDGDDAAVRGREHREPRQAASTPVQ